MAREGLEPPERQSLSARASATGLLLLLAAACTHSIDNGADAPWLRCQAAADCVWAVGEGGWPTAVRADQLEVYQAWLAERAPHTTYFGAGDCFATREAFDAHVERSRESVACRDARCEITARPVCSQ